MPSHAPHALMTQDLTNVVSAVLMMSVELKIKLQLSRFHVMLTHAQELEERKCKEEERARQMQVRAYAIFVHRM